jgi:hypothetical protein
VRSAVGGALSWPQIDGELMLRSRRAQSIEMSGLWLHGLHRVLGKKWLSARES